MAGKDLGTIYYKVDADTTKILDSVAPMNKGLDEVGKTLDKTDAEMKKVGKSSKTAADGIKKVGQSAAESGNKLKPIPKAIDDIGKSAGSAGSALGGFTKLFAGLMTLNFGRTLLEMADSYNEYAERVRMATSSTDEFNKVQDRLLETANKTYRSLSEVQEVYIRTADGLRSMGYDTDQAMDITDSLTYSFVKNASSVDRANGAISAFAKSINKGRVEADAWETIIAAVPSIIDDIAASSGISAQQVRQLGAEGKIAATQLNEGLRQSLNANKAAADGMATTLNDAFRAFGNNLSKFVGEANESVGVTRALSAAIIALADNIGTIVTLVGIVAGAALAKYIAGLAATAFAQLKLSMEAAKTTLALTGQATSMRAATAAAASYTAATAGASASTAAMGAAAATTVGRIGTLGAGLATAGRGIAGVVGLISGPVGIIAALGIAALSFVDFGGGAESASASLLNMKQPLDDIIARVRQLSNEQLTNEEIVFTAASKQSLQDGIVALNGFVDQMEITTARGTKHMASLRGEMRNQLQAMVSDTSLSAEQLATGLRMLADEWAVQAGWTDETKAKYLELAEAFIKTQTDANKTTQVLAALRAQLEAGAGAANELNKTFSDLDPGMDKWGEYLAKLTATRDMIGMNARQLGEFQAAQAGANAMQQQMSGIVTAQSDEFRKLESAIQSKDSAAAEAAKSNIRNLDIERQRVAMLAEQTATLMAVVQNFAKTGVAADVQAGVLTNMNKWFEKRFKDVTASPGIEDQIGRVMSNTLPKAGGGGRKGGGGGGKSARAQAAESDAKAIATMRREIELAALAGTELEKAKATDKLSSFATPEQIAEVKALADELYRVNTEQKKREEFGADPEKHILGDVSPLSGGQFDDQVARYEAEAEAEKKRYADQQKRLEDALSLELVTRQRYAELKTEMEDTNAKRAAQIEEAKNDMLMTSAANAFGNMSQDIISFANTFGRENKAMFAVAKAAAIAQAIIQTYQGAQAAYTAMASIPYVGPALGVAAAAAAVAGGMARVASIRSQSMGGGKLYGGNVDPSKMYRVNENGAPEMMQASNGQQFLLPNTRGKVVSNADASSNSGDARPSIVVNLIENSEKAGSVEEMDDDKFNRRVVNAYVVDIRSGGTMAQATEGTYGLSRKGQ